jgi:ligand-binding SRPBCC domain-containing protein
MLTDFNKVITIEWQRNHQCYVLRSSALLPQSRETVFAFFSDAFQLEQITPTWLSFRISTPPPIHLWQGCLIDYRIRLHGIPIRWQTEIHSWNPAKSFTDRQVCGPYKLWEHLHTFDEVDGGTLVGDTVRYRPWGGRLSHWLIVGRDLRRIFEFRRQRMLELFSTANPIPVTGVPA